MKLWEIAQRMDDVLEKHLDPETGEISDEGLAQLEGFEECFEDEALDVAAFVKHLRLDADLEDAQAKAIKKAAKVHEQNCKRLRNRADGLEQFIRHEMERHGLDELEDSRARIVPGRLKVYVDRPDLVPANLCNPPKPPEPSKTKLGELIQAMWEGAWHEDGAGTLAAQALNPDAPDDLIIARMERRLVVK